MKINIKVCSFCLLLQNLEVTNKDWTQVLSSPGTFLYAKSSHPLSLWILLEFANSPSWQHSNTGGYFTQQTVKDKCCNADLASGRYCCCSELFTFSKKKKLFCNLEGWKYTSLKKIPLFSSIFKKISPIKAESLIISHETRSPLESAYNAQAFNLAQMLSPTVITRKSMKIYVEHIWR